MEKLFLLLLTVVGCCLVDFSHCTSCTVNAPEISLVELHRGCYHTERSREPDCVAAMHRYCYNVAYPTSITTLGVQRERVTDSRIGMSCVKSRLVRDVPITELKTYHPGCTIEKRATGKAGNGKRKRERERTTDGAQNSIDMT